METLSALDILFLLLLFQFKHAVSDGPLQGRWMLVDKGFYGKLGGVAHASTHGLGSFIVVLCFGIGGFMALGLAIADVALHYHIDFTKEYLVRQRKWTTETPYFWWALTVDQLCHQLTYVAIAAAILTWR